MIKLTKDSVGKVYVDGDDNKWGIAAKIPNLDFGFVGIMNEGTDCEVRAFFSMHGRRFDFDTEHDSEPTKKTLVSIYVKPRTRKEIVDDLVEALGRYLADHYTAHHNTVTNLIKEAKEKDWGK